MGKSINLPNCAYELTLLEMNKLKDSGVFE